MHKYRSLKSFTYSWLEQRAIYGSFAFRTRKLQSKQSEPAYICLNIDCYPCLSEILNVLLMYHQTSTHLNIEMISLTSKIKCHANNYQLIYICLMLGFARTHNPQLPKIAQTNNPNYGISQVPAHSQ